MNKPISKNKRKGQVILEVIWLLLFASAFLTLLAHLYEKGKKEIELSRSQHKKKNVRFGVNLNHLWEQ